MTARDATATLPTVDEHSTTIDAPIDEAWAALLNTLDRSLSGSLASTYARAVGCADTAASGPRPLRVGSTIVGFRVTRDDAPHELLLEGRHRFSTYSLCFRLERRDAQRTDLRADTRAAFPGVPGRIYRLLVIDSRAHVVAVRRLLADVRRRANPRSPTTSTDPDGSGR
jgi:hypothetical protein